jgi:transposase-like protein
LKANSKNTRSFERKHPAKNKADQKKRHQINNAIRDGRMKKPKGKCPNCGKTGGRIEYDHGSGKWKCSLCHDRGPGAK